MICDYSINIHRMLGCVGLLGNDLRGVGGNGVRRGMTKDYVTMTKREKKRC